MEKYQLVMKIRQIHQGGRELYGSPRITQELRAQGYHYNEKRIGNLMRLGRVAAKTRGWFKVTTTSKAQVGGCPESGEPGL